MGIFRKRRKPRDAETRRTAEQMARRMYAAAKTSKDGWRPLDLDINTLIKISSPAVRARVRQLVRDFPLLKKAVGIRCDNDVGTGIKLQAATGDERLNQQIEDAWERACGEIDAGGRLHWYDLQRLCSRQESECGEWLLVRRRLQTQGRFLPLALQAYEADWLTDMGSAPTGRNTVEQGIEINTSTGAPEAYWFQDPDGWGKPIRVPAADVLHGFEVLRPGQLRGISPFTAAVLLSGSLGEYISAEVDGAKAAAKWLAFITSNDLEAFQELRKDAAVIQDGQRIDELENAVVEYLRPGEEIKLANSNRPNTGAEAFAGLLARWIAVGVDCTYERITGDYRGINYSNLRGIRNDEHQQAQPRQQRLIRQLCQPVHRWFLDELALHTDILPQDYWKRRWQYQRASHLAPGLVAVDPLKETKSNLQEIAAGLRSPREIVRSRGRDLAEVLEETAADLARAKALGLALDMGGSKAQAQSPASLGAS